MKRLSLLAALPLVSVLLMACGTKTVQTPDAYDLSGTIAGNWDTVDTLPRLRLALVGTGLPNVVTNDSNREQNVVIDTLGNNQFGFDLPQWPDLAGVYQVIAFDDRNNNARYDVGEPMARNSQWLIFTPKGGTVGPLNIPAWLPGAGEEAIPALSVAQGWNLYDRAQPLSSSNPQAVTKVTGYNLVR